MANDPSWIDALPGVTDHPAAQPEVPGGPAAALVVRPQQSPSAAAAGQAPSWIDALPSVTDHPAAQGGTMPAGAPPPASGAQHPVAGPSGSLVTDTERRLGTAATDTLGGLLGLPSAAAHAVDWTGRQVGVDPGAQAALGSIKAGGQPLFPDPATAREMAYQTTGATEYQPETAWGRVGQGALTGAMSAPIAGAFRIAAGLPAALRATGAAIPGMAGAAGAGAAAQEVAPGNVPAQIGASLLGGKAGSMLANVGTSMTGLRTPAGGPLDPETAALAQAAQQHGISIAPSQLSNNFFTRTAYDLGGRLPLSGSDAFAEAQRTDWMRAVNRTMGETADKITPDVMGDARAHIGGVFNGVAQRTVIPTSGPPGSMGDQFLPDLQNVVNRAKVAVSSDTADAAQRAAMNIIDTAANNGGNIGGKAYIDLTAKGGPLDDLLQSADLGRRQVGGWLRDTIDDHFQAAASPQDVAALQQARGQWKAMRTIEPLTLRADTVGGATPSTGDISPAALRFAVNQSYKNAAFAPLGQIPLNDLAKIGQRFLKTPQSSATAERSMAGELLKGGGGLGAAAFGFEHAGVPATHGLAATAAALALNRATQGAMRNQWLAHNQIAGSLNPNGFRFQVPVGAAAAMPAILPPAPLPFSWAQP